MELGITVIINVSVMARFWGWLVRARQYYLHDGVSTACARIPAPRSPSPYGAHLLRSHVRSYGTLNFPGMHETVPLHSRLARIMDWDWNRGLAHIYPHTHISCKLNERCEYNTFRNEEA